MAKKKKPGPQQAPPAPEAGPAQPPPDNPLLRHADEVEDKNAKEMALERLKALEELKQAERRQK
jgi:hypothetical protein